MNLVSYCSYQTYLKLNDLDNLSLYFTDHLRRNPCNVNTASAVIHYLLYCIARFSKESRFRQYILKSENKTNDQTTHISFSYLGNKTLFNRKIKF